MTPEADNSYARGFAVGHASGLYDAARAASNALVPLLKRDAPYEEVMATVQVVLNVINGMFKTSIRKTREEFGEETPLCPL